MTDNVRILLTVLVAGNVVLIVLALGRAWIRRRRTARFGADIVASAHGADVGPGAHGADVGPGAHGLDPARTTAVPRGLAPPVPMFGPSSVPSRTDPLTGMLLPGEWSRILADEDARIHRYGRPATIVLLEIDGLDRLVSALGQEAGDRILPAVADSLSRYARGADHVARLGPGRFGVLLPETGEVEAVNYVERVRQVCELWLESGAIALRLAIGWASPDGDGSLGDAFNEAQDRMFAELHRGSRRGAGSASDGPPPAPGLEAAPSPA